MSDLIRRDDAIRELNGSCSNWEDDAKVQEIIMAIPSAKPTGELISKTEAVELLTEIVFDEPPYFDSETLCRLYAEEQINTLPSAEIAETEPIVIRSRTLLPTKDFREWAKRIKEVNPYAVVIPCDAEVASAEAEDRLYIKIYADDEPSVKAEKLYQICGETQNREVTEWLKEYFPAEAVQGWIPCSERLPKRDELVLVTYKTTDRIHLCRYLDDGSENPWWSYIDDCCAWNNVVLAWMPLPTPYKGGEDDNA